MFLSQGNSGPGINTAGDPGLCGNVLGIGAYITSDTYHADYGTPMPFQDNLHYFSSRGPREDGGFAPVLVAPGAAISSIPMWQNGPGLRVPAAAGLALFNGTSMAAPQARRRRGAAGERSEAGRRAASAGADPAGTRSRPLASSDPVAAPGRTTRASA